MGDLYERFCMGDYYGRFVWEKLVGEIVGRFVWEISMGVLYRRFIWEITIGDLYGSERLSERL